MNIEFAKFGFDIIQTLLIAIIGIMNWLNNRQKVTSATISRLENNIDTRLDDQGERLTRVEETVKHVPNHDDFKRVHQRLDTLNGAFHEVKGELQSFKATLNLIHQYLMEHK